MKMSTVSNKFDYGTLRVANEHFCGYSLVVCGLSLGVERRSEFTQCNFSNIKIRKCSVGFPIFSRCRFENIASDRNGVLVYGAAFKECVFAGSLKNVVIGLASEYVAATPEQSLSAQKFQAENLEMAATSKFSIDVREADLEFVAFRGEAIIPYVRYARNQAIMLRATDLFDKLRKLGRAQINRAKSDFFLGTGVLPGSQVGIATFNKEVRQFIPEIENELREIGIEVSHYNS